MGKPSMWLRINTYTRSHMEVLMKSIMQVFEECQRLGLTTDQRHFSAVVLGRSPNWLSSSASRDRRWSTEMLLTLYFALVAAEPSSRHRETIRELRFEVWREIGSRVSPTPHILAA